MRRARPSTVRAAASAPAPLRLGPHLYAVHTQPGFQNVARSEVAARIAGAGADGVRMVPGRAGMAFVEAPRPDGLKTLRTVEDIFAVVGYRAGLERDALALEKIRALARGAPYVESGLAARVKLFPASRAGRRLRFKVVARLAGEHEFRRADFGRAVEAGIAQRADRTWRPDESASQVEFWATMLGGELIIALRLSDDRMRIRDYKRANIPGSLRPSVAAALAWLSQPRDGEVVLDPLCGAGTVLIERAHLGRYAMLLGGDSESAALAAARENVGPRYKPIELRLWDATALPLARASVDKIVTNLPWGIRHGSHRENRRLYPRLAAEFRRVLKPGGTMVLLTAERHLMREIFAQGLLSPSQVIDVMVLGTPCAVYVCIAA